MARLWERLKVGHQMIRGKSARRLTTEGLKVDHRSVASSPIAPVDNARGPR